MKTTFNKFLATGLILSLGFILLSFLIAQQPGKPWDVPAKYKNMKNPSPGDNIDIGKALWAKHCKSCHGAKGLGDGPKSKNA